MSTINESWGSIKGFSEEFSSLGRVRRIKHGVWIQRKLNTKHGYVQMKFRCEGQVKFHYVHVLIAKAFIGEKERGIQVNHINGNKSDNRLENLEYCTVSENHKHAFRMGLKSHKGAKHTQAKLNDIRVLTAKLAKMRGVSSRALADIYGVSRASIDDAVLGRHWPHVRIDGASNTRATLHNLP